MPVIFGNRKPDNREAFLFTEMTPDNSKMYKKRFLFQHIPLVSSGQ
ncbi:MAG: hypothetical protein EPO58_16955 [Chitinophagaceae bacterium]|nr:MAG: hypothetical protein EPO58_16955 [Chitinophagaceae bacterium]